MQPQHYVKKPHPFTTKKKLRIGECQVPEAYHGKKSAVLYLNFF
jgi:hypothetical protein